MRALVSCAAASFAALLAGASAGAGEGGDAIRMLAGHFDGLDANKDGRLDEMEFEVGEFFGVLDRNKDGFVTKDELEAAAKDADSADPPAKDGGTKDGKEPGGGKGGRKGPKDRGPGKGGGDMDRGPDETFDDWARRRIAVDPRWNADARAKQALRSFDRDPQDGKIERKEYPSLDGDRVFRRYDRDQDGALDEKELLPLAKAELEDLQKSRKRPDRYEFHTLFDIDNDRRVTTEEYTFLRGPERQFREYDTDGDGTVAYQEILDYRTDRERRRDAEAAAKPRSLWDIHDADKDGRVSAEEFAGGEAVFRRLDKNRDGYLTPADV
jgi:Ca2+-binding EF-hand superfamily protein